MALACSLGMDMGTQVIPAKVDRLGYMLDCSRNAVAKPEMVKDLISFLILAGYNYLELYTEDTYALPDEPYFGYRRGRYTVEELEEIIFHASSCEFQNLYFEITNKFMKKNTYDKTVELKLSKLGKEVHALGGALIAIENVVFAN